MKEEEKKKEKAGHRALFLSYERTLSQYIAHRVHSRVETVFPSALSFSLTVTLPLDLFACTVRVKTGREYEQK